MRTVKDSDQTARMRRPLLNLRWTHMSEGTFSDVAAGFDLIRILLSFSVTSNNLKFFSYNFT